jgi:hypothetical protein
VICERDKVRGARTTKGPGRYGISFQPQKFLYMPLPTCCTTVFNGLRARSKEAGDRRLEIADGKRTGKGWGSFSWDPRVGRYVTMVWSFLEIFLESL